MNAAQNLNEIYLEQSDKYYDEIMLVSLLFKHANNFTKLKQNNYCNTNKCQKYLFKFYKYDPVILKDTILFIRFLFEYTGKDKVQEKRMAVKVFNDLLIFREVKSYYNNDLLKLINDTIDLYVNCDAINDIDKNLIINYRNSIKK